MEENIYMLKHYSNSKSGLEDENDKYDCLVCFLGNFFIKYQFSKEKTLNAYNMREVLISLNDHIQKFNSTGVRKSDK